MTLLVGRQEGHPACKKTEWWGAGVVICLERCVDLHMAQLMPPPLTVSCSNKIQIGFTFLVPAHLGSPGQRVVKRVYVCMSVFLIYSTPVEEAKYCDDRVCLSVCSSVREHISGTTCPIFTKFLCMLPMSYTSVLLWRRCDMLRISVFS